MDQTIESSSFADTAVPREKTSAGLPVIQPFTPPSHPSVRVSSTVFSAPSALEKYFPEEMKSHRPSSETINRPREEVASLLKNLDNFPKFFEHLEKIESESPEKGSWHFRGSEKLIVEMKSVQMEENHVYIWESEDSMGFHYKLGIELIEAQANRGTVVRAMTSYDSKISKALSQMVAVFGKDSSTLVKKNLQRLKSYCETGHVPTTEGQPSGRDSDSVILSSATQTKALKNDQQLH